MQPHRQIEQIDVVCSVYNHENYLQECIESIFMQKNVYVKLHIVDDASTDKSLEIAQKYLVSHPGQMFIYANPINMGNSLSSINSNKLQLSSSYWTYIEGDDFLINPYKFFLQIRKLEQDSEIIATASQCLFWDTKKNEKTIMKPDLPRWNFFDLVSKSNSYRMYCHISSIVWKSSSRYESNEIYSKNFSKRQFNSEVLFVHYVLKESNKYIEFQDIEGSCYRYTGEGIWSSLTTSEQSALNEKLQWEIHLITPLWIKTSLYIKKYKARLKKYREVF